MKMIGSFRSLNEVGATAALRLGEPELLKAKIAEAQHHGISWLELLDQTIETEILPRMIEAQQAATAAARPAAEALAATLVNETAIGAYVDLILANDMEEMRAVADRVIVQCGGRQALLDDLLTPAARRLGDLWEQDICDFMQVTIGVYQLDQIMKETASLVVDTFPATGFDHRILLLPVSGEQHRFGTNMLADVFREAGWCVRSGNEVSRAQLLRLVKAEWFDVVGLSLSADRWLKGLPATIRALRAASCNPRVFVMLGGRAIDHCAERTRFMGVDAIPGDAWSALAQAEAWMRRQAPEQESSARAGLGENG